MYAQIQHGGYYLRPLTWTVILTNDNCFTVEAASECVALGAAIRIIMQKSNRIGKTNKTKAWKAAREQIVRIGENPLSRMEMMIVTEACPLLPIKE